MKSRSKRKKKNYIWSRVPNIKRIIPDISKQVQNIKLQNKEEQIHLTGMAEEQNVLFVGVCFTGLKIASTSVKNKKKMKKNVSWLCLQKNTNLKMRYSEQSLLDMQSLIQHVPRLYVEKDGMKNVDQLEQKKKKQIKTGASAKTF